VRASCWHRAANRVKYRIDPPPSLPQIPDFELIGRIGGGAYGEVFLARTVTGRLRAVKVVAREDFEYEKTFEREFEGIQRYEKVSQNHPGLVDVLHVGRNREARYYYYVMELADDLSGTALDELDVTRYRARTLSSDLRRGTSKSIRECVSFGAALADALGHLHRAGLTHRDVKPSNIIFVKGEPKLADVGLVAHSGQRTYVGTEGYVPPEGPGSNSADLYSLAMVLYEMHTGRDRMDFPELPTNLEIPPTVNRDEWRALNAVICRGGSPDPRKRYESAEALAKALRAIVPGEELSDLRPGSHSSARGVVIVGLALFALVAGGGWWLWQDIRSFLTSNADLLTEAESIKGEKTDLAGNAETKVTEPKVTEPIPVVTVPSFELLANQGHDPENIGPVVILNDPKKDPAVKPPVVEADPLPADPPALVATVVPDPVPQGQVRILTNPPGASVWSEGESLGNAQDRVFDFTVGALKLTLKKPGFLDLTREIQVHEGLQTLDFTMLLDRSPAPGQDWLNSAQLAFEFEPGSGHITKTEVPFALFDAYLVDSGLQIPVSSGLNGTAQVRDDAAVWGFCDWLSKGDRDAGFLKPNQYLRFQRSSEAAFSDAFFLSVDNADGTLLLNSEPPGARVFHEGQFVGITPTALNEVRHGPYRLEFALPGYSVREVTGELADSEPVALPVILTKDGSVSFTEPWENSLGTTLVPLGGLLVARTETRVRDYREFITATGIFTPPATAFPQALDHPVAGVDRGGAEAFCAWLTEREQTMGLIRPWQRYRLPTDREWSLFAGLANESGATPAERAANTAPIWSWGDAWPPPTQAGNFADESAAGTLGSFVIPAYLDSFPATSPVGSFTVGPEGLFDLSGNVWEWVSDPYQTNNDTLGVVRGGAWNSSDQALLALGYRNPVPVGATDGFYGFRYVLEDGTGNE